MQLYTKCEVYKRNVCFKIECYLVWHLTNFRNLTQFHKLLLLALSVSLCLALSRPHKCFTCDSPFSFSFFSGRNSSIFCGTKLICATVVLCIQSFNRIGVQTIFGFCIGCSKETAFTPCSSSSSDIISRFASICTTAKLFDYA